METKPTNIYGKVESIIMLKDKLYNTNVAAERVLISPADLKRHLPISERGEKTVWEGRKTIRDILGRKDPRLLVVTGPCSIHDVEGAKDYARRLSVLLCSIGHHNYNTGNRPENRKRGMDL